jgi:hypothetical protein
MAIAGRRGLATLLGLAAGVAYAGPVRRWMRRWGATEEDQTRPLAGDDLVAQPVETSTRAIRVVASPALVWPCLQGMGGWSNVLEELLARVPGAPKVRVQVTQATLSQGDVIPIGIGELRVERVEPEKSIVLRSSGPGFDFTWATVLEPEGTATRVVTRVRYMGNRTLFAALDPVAFAGTWAWLASVKRRAEAAARRDRLTG